MVATLPGRTHGLGLVTEPLMKDLAVGRVPYATINFWATLFGAAFCLPCGWLIDRLGVRVMLAIVMVPLGVVVIAMSLLATGSSTLGLPDFEMIAVGKWASLAVPADLFLLVSLTRGFGQSALSIVSLALIGKVAGGKAGPVMGFYSFLTAGFFMAAFGAIRSFDMNGENWRTLWGGIGLLIVIAGIAFGLVVRDPAVDTTPDSNDTTRGQTLHRALLTPTFWVFSLSMSLFALISSGVTLFNQSLLEERGFDRSLYLKILSVGPLVGLAANLVTGWLARRIPLGPLLGAAMAIVAGSLFAFPQVGQAWHVYAYAVAMGIGGGMITVLFFTVWGQAFGLVQLGRIQGAAQLLTVLASAAGPLIMAIAKNRADTYMPLFTGLAWASLAFAIAAAFTRLPKREP